MAQHDAALEAELERRLRAIEDPAYDDPAHRELPQAELWAFLGVAVLIALLALLLWG
jgi:hypothetical protein